MDTRVGTTISGHVCSDSDHIKWKPRKCLWRLKDATDNVDLEKAKKTWQTFAEIAKKENAYSLTAVCMPYMGEMEYMKIIKTVHLN
jgi:hypothetical protein